MLHAGRCSTVGRPVFEFSELHLEEIPPLHNWSSELAYALYTNLLPKWAGLWLDKQA